MNTLPLILASLLYAWQAVIFFLEAKYGMSLAFFAYCLANGGFILAARGL